MQVLNIQPFGTLGRNLLRLSQLGVDVVYREGSLRSLAETINSNRPCITLVRTEFLPYWEYTTDHAVVVVGMDDDLVYLNDPAFANHPIRATMLEFELAWMELDYRYCTTATGSTSRA
jgi:predicted double-glycine peptidase